MKRIKEFRLGSGDINYDKGRMYGIKEGKEKTLREIGEIMNKFLDNFTIKNLVPRGAVRGSGHIKDKETGYYILLKDFKVLEKRIRELK